MKNTEIRFWKLNLSVFIVLTDRSSVSPDSLNREFLLLLNLTCTLQSAGECTYFLFCEQHDQRERSYLRKLIIKVDGFLKGSFCNEESCEPPSCSLKYYRPDTGSQPQRELGLWLYRDLPYFFISLKDNQSCCSWTLSCRLEQIHDFAQLHKKRLLGSKGEGVIAGFSLVF